MTFTKSQKEQELVLARMEVLSPDLVFSSGGSGATYTRDEMMQHVRDKDEAGSEFVKIEMDFLRAIKSGDLIKRLTV